MSRHYPSPEALPDQHKAVLEVIPDDRFVQTDEVARLAMEVGISPSSIHNIMHRMRKEGYVEGRQNKQGNKSMWSYRRYAPTKGERQAPPPLKVVKDEAPKEAGPLAEHIDQLYATLAGLEEMQDRIGDAARVPELEAEVDRLTQRNIELMNENKRLAEKLDEMKALKRALRALQ